MTVLSPTVDLTQDYTERTTLRINSASTRSPPRPIPARAATATGSTATARKSALSVTRKYRRHESDGGRRLQQGKLLPRDDAAHLGVARSGERQHHGRRRLLVLAEPADACTRRPTAENQYQSGGFVSITQTLSKTSIAQLGYEIGHIAGYQNNPFLRADVNGVMVLGQVPDSRTRQTLSARLRQALPADTYLEADYRHYFDDWHVTSNTVSVGLSHHFGRPVAGEFRLPPLRPDRLPISGRPSTPACRSTTPPISASSHSPRTPTRAASCSRRRRSGGGCRKALRLNIQYERYQADNGFQAGILSTGLRMPVKVLNR